MNKNSSAILTISDRIEKVEKRVTNIEMLNNKYLVGSNDLLEKRIKDLKKELDPLVDEFEKKRLSRIRGFIFLGALTSILTILNAWLITNFKEINAEVELLRNNGGALVRDISEKVNININNEFDSLGVVHGIFSIIDDKQKAYRIIS